MKGERKMKIRVHHYHFKGSEFVKHKCEKAESQLINPARH